jgi:hypothetical protein
MKIKNIFKYILLAFVALYMGSCSNNTDAEQLFDKTPTERLNTQKAELNNVLLTSEFGWKAVYFTDDSQLGGYTHLFKFLPGNKVEMASDFDTDTKTYTSDYNVVLGSTVSLLFDTYNRIHLLSDSNSFPKPALRGKGYLGDFQFLYYGQENGDIIFKSNRLVREVRFIKATAQDWVDLPKNFLMIPNFIGKNPTNALYRGLETNDGTTIKKYNLNAFSQVTRFTTTSDNSGIYPMGIGYAPNGIVVSPAVVVGGQKLMNFIYNPTDGNFTATGTNGVSASIKYSNDPFVLTDDYKILLPLNANMVYGHDRSILNLAATNSALFLTLFKDVEAALPAGFTMTRVQPWFNTPSGSYIEYRLVSGTGAVTRVYHFFTLTSDAQKGTITLNATTTWKAGSTFANATPIAPPAFLKNLDDQLTNPKGLYFKRENFTVGSTNAVFTFTGVSSSFRMTTWAFQ